MLLVRLADHAGDVGQGLGGLLEWACRGEGEKHSLVDNVLSLDLRQRSQTLLTLSFILNHLS